VNPSGQPSTHAPASLSASGRPRVWPALAIIAVLLAAAVAVQVVRDRGWTRFEPQNSVMWIRSGPIAKRLALGFDSLVADAYWIRAVVYYGGLQRSQAAVKDYSSLYPLLDLVTTLDPQFKIAYRFGSLFLTEPAPSGPGRPDLAISLLQRGIERDNGRWEYYFDIGFIYYWWLKDYTKAAEWFLRGADRPRSAEWLRPLAATTLAEGASFESSRTLWRQMQNSDVPFIRQQAERRLLQLDAMDRIARLTPILQRFVSREKRYPRSWQELANVEGLRGVPTDPTGVPFYFDPKVGFIDVSPKSTLWPLPREQQRRPPPPPR
jgi:tetratricopeptide (TPR) repeat protein